MPTRRLPETKEAGPWVHREEAPCFHPEHRPPAHQVFRPGRYEHTCPACGKVTFFTVNAPVYRTTVTYG